MKVTLESPLDRRDCADQRVLLLLQVPYSRSEETLFDPLSAKNVLEFR